VAIQGTLIATPGGKTFNITLNPRLKSDEIQVGSYAALDALHEMGRTHAPEAPQATPAPKPRELALGEHEVHRRRVSGASARVSIGSSRSRMAG
jgi:hypothetical protein